MNRDYEQELFDLIRSKRDHLKKEDIAEYLNMEDFNINKEILMYSDEAEFIICEAVRLCNYEIVEALVKNGAELNFFKDQGWNPINWAARYEKIDIIKLLIDNKADLLVQDPQGQTALVNSVLNNRDDIVEIILENYDDSEKAKLDKSYALFMAVGDNNYDIAKLILEHDTDPNIRHGNLKISSIHQATNKIDVGELNIPLISLLLEYDAEIKSSEYKYIICGAVKKIVEDLVDKIENRKEKDKQIKKEIEESSAQITALKRAMAKKSKIGGLKI